MTDNGSTKQDKTGIHLPEKKMMIIAGIAIAVIIIAVIAAAMIIKLPAGDGNAHPPIINNSTQPEKGLPSSQTPVVSKTIRQTVTQSSRETPTTQETSAVPVDFILKSGDPVSCGLTCRQLVATITNTGYETAHNVCITVSLHNSRNEIINLNGEPSIRRCVGNIAGGQSKTEPITVDADCGAFASLCIRETLTLQTRVLSDEKTVQFPDQLIAV